MRRRLLAPERDAPSESLHDLDIGVLLPGIKINTGKADHRPIQAKQLERWTGKTWERFGGLIQGRKRRRKHPSVIPAKQRVKNHCHARESGHAGARRRHCGGNGDG